MSKPYISIQIIAKETTEFGLKMFRACLRSIVQANYASQVVLVNNGCGVNVVNMYTEELQKLSDVDISVSIVDKDGDFSELRNCALAYTDPETDFIHWVDTDEVYFPEKLTKFGSFLSTCDASTVVLNLVHFMCIPSKYQEIYPKDVVYRYITSLNWGSGVHEKLGGVAPGQTIRYDMPYLHFGYCRSQWRTALKWLHYDVIAKGNPDHYKFENIHGVMVPYFRVNRTPDDVVSDRLEVSKTYTGDYPQAWLDEQVPLLATLDEWRQYLCELDDDKFWREWQTMSEEYGGWEDTLANVVQTAKQSNWSLI